MFGKLLFTIHKFEYAVKMQHIYRYRMFEVQLQEKVAKKYERRGKNGEKDFN